jgi:hypothetical protein
LFAAKITGKRKFVDLSFRMAVEKLRTESYANKKLHIHHPDMQLTFKTLAVKT